MLYSEDFFPHLRAAKEQALNREVERIRVQRERAVPGPSFRARVKRWSMSVVSDFRGRLAPTPRPRVVTCAECLAQ